MSPVGVDSRGGHYEREPAKVVGDIGSKIGTRGGVEKIASSTKGVDARVVRGKGHKSIPAHAAPSAIGR